MTTATKHIDFISNCSGPRFDSVYICVSAVFLLWIAFCASRSCADGETPKPNIVYFLVDDMGFADAGFSGATDIKTPNIDRLAKSGAVLTDYYAQLVCSPTRAALLTGRYATHTGAYGLCCW